VIRFGPVVSTAELLASEDPAALAMQRIQEVLARKGGASAVV
jgi:hypothetical protein